MVLRQLENDSVFGTLEDKGNVVDLLMESKEMAFAGNAVQYRNWTYGEPSGDQINQEPRGVVNYNNKFLEPTESRQIARGPIYPRTMAPRQRTTEQQRAKPNAVRLQRL